MLLLPCGWSREKLEEVGQQLASFTSSITAYFHSRLPKLDSDKGKMREEGRFASGAMKEKRVNCVCSPVDQVSSSLRPSLYFVFESAKCAR